MPKPLIRDDLVDAAAALLLCQHDSPLVKSYVQDGVNQFESEPYLNAAREAASAYLVECFNAAVTWNADERQGGWRLWQK